jgi:UDP-galactopyranose mutase
MAERITNVLNQTVLLIDRRAHIGGNAFDELDEAGVLVHRYGPHIFHTNSDRILSYLSMFTDWRPYEHKVLASVRGKHVPLPINRNTINILYDLDLKTDEEAEAFLAKRAIPTDDIKNAEEAVVSQVGWELYELFFKGYTEKQWGRSPTQLDRSVTARIPTRFNTDDRYFTDTHQCMPKDGYTAMFEAMVADERITLALSTDWQSLRDHPPAKNIIFTGCIDEFFEFRLGKLAYRSLRFEHKHVNSSMYQQTGTVNYPAPDVGHTRITEFKHLTGQSHPGTSIVYEYPSSNGEPFYPVPDEQNADLFKLYRNLSLEEKNVRFVGRLANYRYYNMDQVVGQALAEFQRILDDQQQ